MPLDTFNPFILFRVLWHYARIRSLLFVSGSPSRIRSICFISSSLASCSDSIPSFCFTFFDIAPRFDPFLLFWVLRCAWIRSLCFISGSPAFFPDSIPSFCFGFFIIAPGFDSFVLFRVLWHHSRIRSLCFVSGSSTSRPNSIPSFCFGFSASLLDSIPLFCFRFFGIALGLYHFILFWVLQHLARI